MGSDIKQLEALTKALQDVDIEGLAVRSENKVDFHLADGTAILFNLLNKKGVAVADSFMTKGAIFPFHQHGDSKEFFILYRGGLTVICENGDRHELKEGDFCTTEKGCLHSVHALEDSWFIAITIPSDPLFPKK